MKTLTALSLPAIALLIAAAPAYAAKSDAANEVALHIEADAAIPPDQAEMFVSLKGSGATAAEAQAALKTKQADLAKALAATGLGASLVTTSDPVKVSDDDADAVAMAATAACEAAADIPDAAESAASTKRRGKRNSSKIDQTKPGCVPDAPAFAYEAVSTVRITDLSQLDKAQGAATPLGWSAYRYGQGVHYITSNPAAAAKAARERAIAKARKDADDYAASLGYHVVRMTRVSNASPPFSMGDLQKLTTYADIAPSRMSPSYFGSATYVAVGIDFVIAPN
ncbi:MAG: SIMPL domain-containing protein [Novosphingobium sp.]